MFYKLRNLDFTLLILPIVVSIIGVALIYSLVFADSDSSMVFKQVAALVVGVVAMLFLAVTDYRKISNYSWYLYIAVIGLLIYVDLFGLTSGGATRWIDLKVFLLQPSEFYKTIMVIFLAALFGKNIGRMRWADIAYMLLVLAPSIFLILIEPDLGTALVAVFTVFMVLFFLKLSKTQYILISLAVVSLIAVFFLSVYKIAPFTSLLKDYQRSRVMVFIDPSSDPFGRGYNVQQALIAVGSGGLTGKGLGYGSQSQLQFLPKPETDFIFSGYAEAFGLVGSLALLAMYTIIIIRIVDISKQAKDNFGYILAIGIGASLVFQIFVNIAMNIGIAPVTGIPLPFLSYGGSSMVACFIMIGILQSIHIHRKKITF